MSEPESDVPPSQKGEDKGTSIALKMLQNIASNKIHGTIQTCTFVYAFTYHFSSQTVLMRGLFRL